MKATLKSLRQIKANPAVSIFVKTHRKHPENQQDPIALKNQLKLAEDRLTNEYDKRVAGTILEKIHAKTDELDHNYNLDTLAIFASEDDVQLIRLPLDATERVIIGERFATRDLVKDMAGAVHYYVVVVTREYARLIEASNDRVVHEFDKKDVARTEFDNIPFPIENTTLYTTSGADRSAASNEDNYLKEFLNRVDKSVQEMWGEHKMPIIVVGDARNISFYKEVCDRPENIIGSVDNVTDLENGSAEHIVESVQSAVEAYRKELYEQAQGEIEAARGNNLLTTDLQSAYQAAYQGNAERLYVQEGYIQPAKIDETAQTLTPSDDPTADGVNDDAVGEIIEHVMHNGGDVVFLPKGIMTDDLPLALVNRY